MNIDGLQQLHAEHDSDFCLMICQSGEVAIGAGETGLTLEKGSAILLASSDAAKIDGMRGRWLAIRVPRRRLETRVSQIDDLVMQRIVLPSPSLEKLSEFAATLLEDRAAVPAAGHPDALLRYIHDLIALALNASRDADETRARDGIGAIRLIAAKLHVIGHGARSDLSINALAAHLGVSTRYVQRLFEIDGTTFSAFLLDHRLATAYRILFDARYRRRPVSEIAYDVGFGDLSYFNRSFRRRFGETPTAIRQSIAERM